MNDTSEVWSQCEVVLKAILDNKEKSENMIQCVYTAAYTLTAINPTNFQTSQDKHMLRTRIKFIKSMIPIMRQLMRDFPHNAATFEFLLTWQNLPLHQIIMSADALILSVDLTWTLKLRHTFIAASALAQLLHSANGNHGEKFNTALKSSIALIG